MLGTAAGGRASYGYDVERERTAVSWRKSAAGVLLCVGALSAGCAPDSGNDAPTVMSPPPTTGADGAAPRDDSRPSDPTAVTAPASSAGPEGAATAEASLVGLWPYDPEEGYSDEEVLGVLGIEEPCVYLYGTLNGERTYTADGTLERSLLRLPAGFTRYDPATNEIWVHGDGPMTTGDEVIIGGSGGVAIQERPLPGGCTARDFTVAKAMSPGRGPRYLVADVPQLVGLWFPPFDAGGGVARWTAEIVESRPHDSDAFTQGLEIVDGTLYESTGLWGRSSLRAVDAATGEVAAQVELADEFFGEGLTVVGDRIVQLTWQSGTAFVYDRATLDALGEHSYEGEGWGLCAMDDVLIMSDGSDRLAHRDPQTFELLGTVAVTASDYDGRLDYLNELECVDGLVIANVWQTDRLLVIAPDTGRVVAVVDAQPLVEAVLRVAGPGDVDVLNGVAAASDGSATLWMTGKLWPRIYRVRIVEVP